MYYWCFKEQRNNASRTVDGEIRTRELREDIFMKVKVKLTAGACNLVFPSASHIT